MKKILSVILLIGTGIVSQDIMAQSIISEKIIESKSSPVIQTRGSNPLPGISKHKGQRKFLKCPVMGKKRGVVAKCSIKIENEINQVVDVYVDGIYLGSIKENDKGIIESLVNYSEVVCLSSDGKLSWKEKGNCGIQLFMKISQQAQ